MRRQLWALIPVLLITGSACSHRQRDEVEPADAPVRVEVTNHYALPMEVFVAGGGSAYRLGLVNPEMVATFRVPQTLLANGTAEFRAQPTARGPLFRSGELLLAPGTIVDFVITPQLFNSTATIRP